MEGESIVFNETMARRADRRYAKLGWRGKVESAVILG